VRRLDQGSVRPGSNTTAGNRADDVVGRVARLVADELPGGDADSIYSNDEPAND
jgi:hypothetical protein